LLIGGYFGYISRMIEPLQKRRYAKVLTQPLAFELLKLNNARKWHYQNILNCCHTGLAQDGKLTMHYCKSRLCLVCARIKTANMLNKYYPDLKGRDMRMVTLTSKNVPLKGLSERIAFMKEKMMYVRRLNTRVVGTPINGLYTIEITYNTTSRTYHPHVHMLLEASADKCHWFTDMWMKQCSKHGVKVSLKGQHIGERLTNPTQLLEIFKYVTKYPRGKELKDLKNLKTTATMVDRILTSIHNKRMVVTFGNVRAQDEEQREESVYSINPEDCQGSYSWQKENWYSQETGEELVPIKIPTTPKVRREREYVDTCPAPPQDAWELVH
jgi:hypothetical protein